jgi:hypothetical protein
MFTHSFTVALQGTCGYLHFKEVVNKQLARGHTARGARAGI